MHRPILRQKLVPPPAWKGALLRTRLIGALDEALDAGAHVGLFAGTGYGKTMLLADWARATQARPQPPLHDQPPALAWLTLDAEDADLDAFLTYLVAAFEHALPEFRTEAKGLLARARERDGAVAALSALLADLDEQVDRPTWLVLDDYQLAASPSLDALLTRLLRYMPPMVRLVLSARKRPEVGLAALQASGGLVVLDEAALAFDRAEIEALQPGAASDEVLASTGGWPAAMGMPAELLDAYLDEQLLAGLEPATQQFLQRVALVESFDADLCEEALDERFTRERRERLLRDGLIHAHGRDRWVLHAPLRTMLIRRFQADVSREERRELQARVAAYLWGHGQPLTALRTWIEAGAEDLAALRLAEVAERWIAEGRLEALDSALEALDVGSERPELLFVRGELYRRWGDFPRADACFEGVLARGGSERTVAKARIGRAQIAATRGQIAAARELLEGLEPAIAHHRDLALDVDILHGGLDLLSGETRSAIARYEAALVLGKQLDDTYARARAMHNMGICTIRLGEFERALATYDEALTLVAEDGTPLVWMAPINRALVLIHLGRTEEAVVAARDALALVRRYKHTREEGFALRILGFAYRWRGDYEAAAASYATAEHLARAAHDVLGLAYSLNFQAELAVLRQDVPTALRLIDAVEEAMGGADASQGILDFAQVRAQVLVAAGRTEQARALITGLLESAWAKGYLHIARDVERLAATLDHDRPVAPEPAPEPVRDERALELEIFCFGGLRVLRADGEVGEREWQTARARQLFLYLLFNPEGATKPQLLQSVFAHEEVSNDLMNITLLRLRKALEPSLEKGQPSHFILRTEGRYAFNRQARVAVDVDRFEQALAEARPGGAGEQAALERTLALYRGEFAPEFTAAWVDAIRLRLKEQALGVCRRLLAFYDAQAPERSLGLLRRATEIDPLSDEFNRELILRHLEAGEPHLARQQYDLCARFYRELLGDEPPPDLASLVTSEGPKGAR